VISLAHELWVLLVISVLVLFLTFLAKIPLSLFLKRILLFVPFTAIVALPAIFITPGQSLVEVGGRTIISQQGLLTAGFLILRVVDSVSFGLLLILTTTWTNILEALRWFRLPSLLVDVLGMTYRYIFLLLHLTNSMFLARRSRMIAGFSVNENRKWLGRALATVMARSQHLSEEVYQAMVSRGYPGETRVLNQMSLKSRDFIWLAAALAVGLILLWGNYRWT
jgi:cobalt ECF transporter T component CbiQ